MEKYSPSPPPEKRLQPRQNPLLKTITAGVVLSTASCLGGFFLGKMSQNTVPHTSPTPSPAASTQPSPVRVQSAPDQDIVRDTRNDLSMLKPVPLEINGTGRNIQVFPGRVQNDLIEFRDLDMTITRHEALKIIIQGSVTGEDIENFTLRTAPEIQAEYVESPDTLMRDPYRDDAHLGD